MRRASAWLLTLVLLLVFAVPAQAAGDVRVLTNGMITHFDNTITDNGRVLLPVDSVAGLFGLKAAEADGKITLTRDGTAIVLTADAPKAQVNGQDVTLDTPARKVNGQTYVPLRFVAEASNTVAVWSQQDQLIKLMPARDFLDQLKTDGQGDEKVTGSFSIAYEIGGAPGFSFNMGMKMNLMSQTYKGDSLTKMSLDMEGDSMVMEEAVVGGRTFVRDSSSGTWEETGLETARRGSKSEFSPEALFGDTDLAQMGKELADSAKIALAGTVEQNGVKLVKVKVDLPPDALESMISKLLGDVAPVGIPGAQGPNLKVNHFTFTFWGDPNTMLMRHFDMDMDATMSDQEMNAHMTLKGAFDLAPQTEPIQFPADLPK